MDRAYRCTVRARSAAARFTLRVLKFNDREFLLDFWQELALAEAEALRDARKARQLLRRALRTLRQHPTDPDLQEIATSFRNDLREARQTLAEALRELPFPFEG
jgi:pyruvate-formate lyase